MVRNRDKIRPSMSRTVASSVLLASNKSLGVEKTSVRTIPDFVDDIGFKVNVKRSGHMFARRSL